MVLFDLHFYFKEFFYYYFMPLANRTTQSWDSTKHETMLPKLLMADKALYHVMGSYVSKEDFRVKYALLDKIKQL